MSVISTFARRSARAAAMPPNPPQMITTRGRAGRDGWSGKSLLERSGGERHEKHQEDQQNTVRGRCSERQRPKLRQNFHGYWTIGVRVQDDARYELADRRDRREQPTRHQSGSRGG